MHLTTVYLPIHEWVGIFGINVGRSTIHGSSKLWKLQKLNNIFQDFLNLVSLLILEALKKIPNTSSISGTFDPPWGVNKTKPLACLGWKERIKKYPVPCNSAGDLFRMVKKWPFGKVKSDLQRSGIKRSRLESPGSGLFHRPKKKGSRHQPRGVPSWSKFLGAPKNPSLPKSPIHTLWG